MIADPTGGRLLHLPHRRFRFVCASLLSASLALSPVASLAQDAASKAPAAATADGTSSGKPQAEAAPDASGSGTQAVGAQPAAPTMSDWKESVSLIGPSKYPADFKHFDYVNPDAPKGGTLDQIATGTFDSFNPYIVRGTPAAGFGANSGGLIYDTLMDQSPDEPGTAHALIAEAVRYPSDYSSVTFRLNPKARWHDGKPITVEDVIWSFETLTKLHPFWSSYYRNVKKAEKTGDHEVTFTFDQADNRELPNIMGDLVVLPKHWWEGTDASGKKRDITQPTTEIPLGSGPYRIDSFQPGQSITWKRVDDYWAKDNPTRVGRFNYGTIKYVYFRDANAAWEGFKKGGLDDYRVENRAARWAEGYDFPAVKDGKVIRKTFDLDRIQPMQAFVMNLRLPKFQDRRVRKALTLAFNFQEMNRRIFYGAYARTTSFFQNSELASHGLPSKAELKYLDPLKGKIPDEVFTQEFKLPDYSEPSKVREYLRQANDLLLQAGYERRGTELVNPKTGEPLSVDFLGSDPTSEIVMTPFANALKRLGIKATINIVDPNQYVERMRNFNFEITTDMFSQSESPGNEQRDFWSSRAAKTPGSRNTAGIANPAVDQLVDDIIHAPDRESLVAATRALDRVLLFEYYVVPQWYIAKVRLAYWDKLQLPEKQPGYLGIDPFSWWVKSAGSDQAAAD